VAVTSYPTNTKIFIVVIYFFTERITHTFGLSDIENRKIYRFEFQMTDECFLSKEGF
jgi:hypothetical protein